ncbi:hypothetical protein HZZ00_25665 [Streptomyces sp. NEAU-sy36]|uniref:hypothetical protein n=1 Tax=unclassified Streptomyces TaxID=2593676 RepID=UPI0015D57983|nr:MULTISPECIES: hypothetical protein [unclassified Streptomyces]QLJ04048.1 hypothetical protein HZZ00_25665 [Streptomyces sp. NEAU-sy36]
MKPDELNARTQRWFVCAGFVSTPLMFVGLALARVIFPAHNAKWSANHIVHIYERHPNLVQTGLVVAMIAFALWGLWMAVISMWIWRMESRRYPVLTIASILLAAINVMVVEMMCLMYAVTAFRAGEINPQITLSLNDISWFLYYYTWPPYILWLLVVAIAVFRDKSVPMVFPRWFGWLTIGTVVVILPNVVGAFPFAEKGPFAWDGFITFWLVAAAVGTWSLACDYLLMKAIGREGEKVKQYQKVVAPVADVADGQGRDR